MNKKMLLSILIIAFVGIAAAGTWANFVVGAETEANTLTAGILGLSLGQAGGDEFSVDQMIPGQEGQITYMKVWQHPRSYYPPGHQFTIEDEYYIEPTNTGNIPGQLFISGTESASVASLMENVDIYYSTDEDDDDPTLLTTNSEDMLITLGPSGENDDSVRVYFWYSYKNVENQNAEMGQTLNSIVKFELKNPVSVPGTPILDD